MIWCLLLIWQKIIPKLCRKASNQTQNKWRWSLQSPHRLGLKPIFSHKRLSPSTSHLSRLKMRRAAIPVPIRLLHLPQKPASPIKSAKNCSNLHIKLMEKEVNQIWLVRSSWNSKVAKGQADGLVRSIWDSFRLLKCMARSGSGYSSTLGRDQAPKRAAMRKSSLSNSRRSSKPWSSSLTTSTCRIWWSQ